MATNPATPSRSPTWPRDSHASPAPSGGSTAAIGLLFTVCLVTAAILSTPFVSELVGRRFIGPASTCLRAAAAAADPGLGLLLSAAFRADVRRLNRFTPRTGAGCASKDRRSGRIPVGKFNAGQKLERARSSLGAILVLLMTGIVMY